MKGLWDQLELLPGLLGAHVLLTLGALALGIAVSLPLAYASLRSPVVRAVSLTIASVMQTVPSIAMLAFMVVAFKLFGAVPALIGLTVYSILPILRNTITGIEGVDRAVVEAARGVGMTRGQVLRRVQVPIAAPVIIAGVRIATVWVVGIATLGTPVGADCLGNYIFRGLQLRSPVIMSVGIVSAILLAVVLDQLIRVVESGVMKRARGRVVFGLIGLALVFLLSLAPGAWRMVAPAQADGGPGTAVDGPDDFNGERLGVVRVGSKTFTEQYILAELIGRRLEADGYRVDRRESLGSTAAFEALANDDIDVYVDYTGTIWANHMKRGGTGGRDEVLVAVAQWVATQRGMELLGPLGFENAYALAMREADAAALGIETIDDLAAHAPGLSIGGDYEFFGRPEWGAMRDAYGLSFDRQQSMDSTLMYEAVAQGQVDVISAFSTDGRIAAYDLRVLDDPREALPPYDAVLLLSPRARAEGRVGAVLRDVLGSIDDGLMRRANMLVDVERESVAEATASIERSLGDGVD